MINTKEYFNRCRKSIYNGTDHFLLARIASSEQEKDLSIPPNCDGYGRVRHFHRILDEDWYDPLPMDPMAKSLNLAYTDMIKAQVFQIASCNLRCWYCFVPDALKQGSDNVAKWFTTDQMVDMLIKNNNDIRLIDLSGGNPELAPEWIFQMMQSLEKKGVHDKIYLWSDDTLTTSYFFDFLSHDEIRYIKDYPNYGKVGCFKGFDEKSFCYNTNLNGTFYNQQFELFKRYLDIGLDMYAYVTLTVDDVNNLEERISAFIDKLKTVHPLLPLRVVPLKIVMFSPVKHRNENNYKMAMNNQIIVHKEWRRQLRNSYGDDLVNCRICDINLSQ